MSGLIFILIIILIIFGLSSGRILNYIPFIFLLGLLWVVSFGFGIFSWLLGHPMIFLVLIVGYLLMPKNATPKKKTTFYYRNTGDSKGFEDFFRQNGNFYEGNNNGSYQNNYQTFTGYQDLSGDYRNIGVNEQSTKEEVKKAYRELAKKYHPDKFMNATEKEKLESERKFKEINESYEKISKKFN